MIRIFGSSISGASRSPKRHLADEAVKKRKSVVSACARALKTAGDMLHAALIDEDERRTCADLVPHLVKRLSEVQ